MVLDNEEYSFLIFKELLHNILSFFMDPRKYPFSEWKSEVIIIGAD